MKTFPNYIIALLVAVLGFTSCSKEYVEPAQPAVAAVAPGATADPASSSKNNEFADGVYIVFYKGNLGLETAQDIERLTQEIARSPIVIQSILDFGSHTEDGTKGCIADMKKNQARRFAEDPRVFILEADQPLPPPVMDDEEWN